MSRSFALLLVSCFALAAGRAGAQDAAVDAAVAPAPDAAPEAEAEAAPAADTEADASDGPTERATPPVHDPTLLIIGVTTAAVGVVGFGILAASAVSERGRVSAGCGGMCSDADRNAADGLGIAANVAAGVALVGGVLSLIGIAVMGRPEPEEPEEREEEIRVAVGPTGVVVSGAF